MSIHYRTRMIDGVSIFYREAGDPAKPMLVLLHGYPSSSHMFRDLMPRLADAYHLIAPDYPGYGYSDAPSPDAFTYTFDHLTEIMWHFLTDLGLTRFALYVMDYGAPIGFRIASQHPEVVSAIISQNGNAYEAGFTPFWDPIWAFTAQHTPATEAPIRDLLTLDATRWQYTTGVRDVSAISPDAWTLDQSLLDRPGNAGIQLRLFADYQQNRPLYPAWHAYFRAHQPPLLAIWGQNDPIFGPDGARAFANDLPHSEIILLDTGHFALEEDGDVIATHIRRFLTTTLATPALPASASRKRAR